MLWTVNSLNQYLHLFGNRWAFIDLTAAPFTWGPTVGGEGVRVERSLPSVDESFGPHSVMNIGTAQDIPLLFTICF